MKDKNTEGDKSQMLSDLFMKSVRIFSQRSHQIRNYQKAESSQKILKT